MLDAEGPPVDGQSPKFRVGWLSAATKPSPIVEEFREGLHALGYKEGEGRNIVIEDRYTGGMEEKLGDYAAELVRLGVDVLVAGSTPAILAAKAATDEAHAEIPIVMAFSADPVGTNLVASNITGLTTVARELSAKQLELLTQAFPSISRVAVLWNSANRATELTFREALLAARALRLRLQSLQVQQASEFEGVLKGAVASEDPAEALLVLGDPLATAQRAMIADFAARHQLPAMYEAREFVQAGGLMAYGPRRDILSRRAAAYVDQLLREEAKPADLPVGRPTSFQLSINLNTARELKEKHGRGIEPSVFVQADELIE